MTIFGWRIPLAASLAVWFLAWEAVGQAKLSMIVPPVSAVVVAGMELMPTQKFLSAAWITLTAFGTGLGLAIVVGIALGVLMARVPRVGDILGLWVNIFVSAPISALVPMLMAIVGIGQATVVVTVFLFAVFVIILDTEVGVRQASPSLLEMARSFGASRRQLYAKVLILAALPEILAGVRLGVIRGVKGVVIGQLLISIIGIGEMFELYSRNFLMEEFWALVILVFLFAFAVSESVAWLERRIEYYAGAR
ncbi:MAG: ABC transporter permease subunit [Rhodospirillales bacterium]|nr:ABC transporter permease subunit [Rhodospirillales bacterium]